MGVMTCTLHVCLLPQSLYIGSQRHTHTLRCCAKIRKLDRQTELSQCYHYFLTLSIVFMSELQTILGTMSLFMPALSIQPSIYMV